MAKISKNNFNALAAVLLVIAPVVVLAAISPSPVDTDNPDYDISPGAVDKIPPEIAPGFYNYVERCAEIVGVNCGDEIVVGALINETVDIGCCQKLVQMGRDCDVALMELLLEFPEFKHYESRAWEGSKRVWNKCNADIKGLPPTPSRKPAPKKPASPPPKPAPKRRASTPPKPAPKKRASPAPKPASVARPSSLM